MLDTQEINQKFIEIEMARRDRRERHLKLRAYKVFEWSLPEHKRPRTPDERNEAMRNFMQGLDAELDSCSTCCRAD